MTDADAHPDHNTRLERDIPADAVLIGCGLGTHPDTAGFIADLSTRYHDHAILWDADALNLIARDSVLQQHLPPRSILTPHPGEFARLYGKALAHDCERIPAAQALAARMGAVIVLKGKYSIISAPDGTTVINPTGNAGMAKGGSGDVLAGLTAALLAQGYAPFPAACLGAYLHGLAADLALETSAINSLTASDIIAAIPAAWRSIAVASA
ncbi:putative YjeF domain protein [Cardiobacterium valvarum F0432]|uniref:Putative YjeF domain protein n=2 Tax=Cardiobacterium valvarum TaxID=194702 RepID=G9ZF57_9GAMM|nr:putative YjeF domain protein [Cardiobacterium valvarum F0432]